jgi:eukaryotic-like serine/threonine-protein kinase
MSEDHQLDKNKMPGELAKTQQIKPVQAIAIGALLANRFEIIAFKGSGEFGSVYRAMDLQLSIEIAVKILHPSVAEQPLQLADFKRELLIIRQLSHPNILRVHEYYQDGDTHFLTMDWVEGESLERLLGQQKLSSSQCLSLFEQLLEGLTFAENQGIQHRDIKPENLLVDHHGRLLIADFGLALIAEETEQQHLTTTPYYAPPEFLQTGQPSQSHDSYSAGVILYQLCCHQLPFSADNLADLIVQKLSSKLMFSFAEPKLALLEPLCRSMIIGNPNKRISTVKKAFDTFNLLTAKAKPEANPVQISRKQVKVKHWLAIFIGILVVSGVFWLNQFFNNRATITKPHSLAILPFTASQQTNDEWLIKGLPDYMALRLSALPEVRVINNARVRQTLTLLGYQGPLNQQQLLFIAELLNVDRFVRGRLIQASPDDQRLSVTFADIQGNNISEHSAGIFSINLNLADTSTGRLLEQITEWLSIKPIAQQLGHSNSAVQMSQIEHLINQQAWSEAESQLLAIIQREPNNALAWFRLGQSYQEQNQELKAEQAFVKVSQLEPRESLLNQIANAELNLIANNLEKAQTIYQNILNVYPFQNELRFKLASVYIEQQAFEAAEKTLKSLLELDPNHPLAWLQLAKVAIWSGNLQIALDEYLLRALVVAKKMQHKSMQGDVLNAMGVAYQRMGQLENALDYYLQGLKIREELGELAKLATSMSNLTAVYSIRGEQQSAHDYASKSLRLFEQLGDNEGIANALNELGIMAEENGNYSQALQHYRDSLNIRMKLDDDWLIAESMNNIGYIYFLLSDPEHAQVYWNQAEQLYKKINDPVGLIRVQENLGHMAFDSGHWQKAFKIFERALTEAQSLDLFEETLVAKAYLAKLAFLQGNISQSITDLEEVYAALLHRKDVRGINEFGLWLAELSWLIGDHDGALSKIEQIKELIETKGSNEQKFYLDTLLQLEAFAPVKQFALDRSLANIDEQLPLNIPDNSALKRLLYWAQQSLNKSPNLFDTLRKKIRTYDLSLHHSEKLKLLELEAFYFYQNDDWKNLELTLREATQSLHQLGNYWRHFQFNRLRAQLAKHQGDSPIEHHQRAKAQIENLLIQLPMDNRKHFMQMQNVVSLNDQLLDF